MRFVLESAKKDATKYTRCIQWLVKRPKKGRGNRKLLPPSNRSQPINEINYGHQSFTYKELCALLRSCLLCLICFSTFRLYFSSFWIQFSISSILFPISGIFFVVYLKKETETSPKSNNLKWNLLWLVSLKLSKSVIGPSSKNSNKFEVETK